MLISLCMIVKNEEKNIKECLDRVLEVVDEAIIVDTGSTDNTKKILDQYERENKITVIDYKWESDFSKARNKSIERAKGKYILILDADERVFCDKNKLIEFLYKDEGIAYTIPIYNIYGNGEMTVSNQMIRLYKNINPLYEGAIHEQLTLDGNKYLGDYLSDNICKIYHFGYSDVVFDEKDKQKRNMDIIKSEIEKSPEDSFNWYNKGVMEMIAGNLEIAIDDFIKAHQLTKGIRMAYHNDLIIRMTQCMIMQKKYNQAINFMKNLLNDSYIKTIPDIYYYLGISYKEIKKNELAIKNFKKALEIGDISEGISKYGVGSYLPLIEWAKILQTTKKNDEAIEKYKEAVYHHKNIKHKGKDELEELLIKCSKTKELEELSEYISTGNSSNDKSKDEDSFNDYKETFKANIKSLIEKNMLEDSKKLIAEYEKLVKDDIDIYSIKGIIHIIESELDQARKILKMGYSIEPLNIDINYNLGYLYELQGDVELAIKYYNQVLDNTEDEGLISDIKNIIKSL